MTDPFEGPARVPTAGNRLRVPEIPAGCSLLDGALLWITSGWYIAPVDASKNPGSLLGNGWPGKTSRDPDQIRTWFASPQVKAIALHVGRSGAVVFDVDHPENLAGPVATALNGQYTGPIQSTRDNQPGRGHYFFALPDDFMSSNSNGALGKDWGDVRGRNGVVIVDPSVHQKEHGRYRVIRPGLLPTLPEELRAGLRTPAPKGELATRASVEDFLATYTRQDSPATLWDVLDRFTAEVTGGAQRHPAALAAAGKIARDAVRGRYDAETAFKALEDRFNTVPYEREPRPGEFAEIVSYIVAETDESESPANSVPAGAPVDRAPDSAALQDGWSFLAPGEPDEPPLWGHADVAALWSSGESLFIFGPPGAGKSTLAHLVVFARLGLLSDVLGHRVTDDGRKVLYLAMDRPKQIQRAMRRLVRPEHEAVLRDRLIVRAGPLNFSITDKDQRDTLRDLALANGVGTVVIDSIKDVLQDASDAQMSGNYNSARQSLLAAGVELIELHHNRKANGTNKEPSTLEDVFGSRWLTAGAGSVISLWQDEPGSPLITLRHIRAAGEKLRDTLLVLDSMAGTLHTRTEQTMDEFLKTRGAVFTVPDAASYLHKGKPTDGQTESVRGQINRLEKAGRVERIPEAAPVHVKGQDPFAPPDGVVSSGRKPIRYRVTGGAGVPHV
jgi:energy-coupling factor transporter ATP-binding protein EcfA2